jgi:hypothetical protein
MRKQDLGDWIQGERRREYGEAHREIAYRLLAVGRKPIKTIKLAYVVKMVPSLFKHVGELFVEKETCVLGLGFEVLPN